MIECKAKELGLEDSVASYSWMGKLKLWKSVFNSSVKDDWPADSPSTMPCKTYKVSIRFYFIVFPHHALGMDGCICDFTSLKRYSHQLEAVSDETPMVPAGPVWKMH